MHPKLAKSLEPKKYLKSARSKLNCTKEWKWTVFWAKMYDRSKWTVIQNCRTHWWRSVFRLFNTIWTVQMIPGHLLPVQVVENGRQTTGSANFEISSTLIHDSYWLKRPSIGSIIFRILKNNFQIQREEFDEGVTCLNESLNSLAEKLKKHMQIEKRINSLGISRFDDSPIWVTCSTICTCSIFMFDF